MSVAERVRTWSNVRVGALPAFPFVVAAVFAIAMALPALRAPGAGEFTGFDLLLEGWRGVRTGSYAWFANPLFGAALMLAIGDFRRAAGVAAGCGCVLALTSFAAGEVARSGGVALPVLGLGPGFYVWLAAQFGLLVWCWLSGRPRAP